MAASPIVVGVRVRPFNQREARFQSQCVVGMDAAGTVKLMQMNGGKISTSQAPREFIYDHAFWTHDRASLDDAVLCAPGVVFADQGYVYEKMATPVVENVMSGFNACLFAYGQTGSGKTYSMMGTPSDRGVLPRLGEAMFDKISALKEGGGPSSADKTLCAVEASFCEIYNEKVRDLMVAPAEHHVSTTGATSGAVQPPPAPVNLPIRLDPKKGVFVEGLTKYNITNADDFYVFLENGLSSRAVGSTNMNNTSSRSHAIVILTVSQTGPKGEKSGKLCLVDLAGSERVAATGATGQTATEGQSINLSLTQLGICLKRLAESAEAAAAAAGKKQAASLPIPYRDSALTFLLKENLGGNSRTAMLANISPASVNFDETLATLRFAQIARKVKSVATMNENPQTKLIVQLREELAELKTRFQNLEARKSISAVPTSNTNTPSASMEPPERQSTLPRPSGPSASSSQNITSSASAQRGTTHSGDRLAESAGGDSGVLVLDRKRSTVASHSTTDGAAEVDSLLGSTMNAHIFGARGSGALQSTSSTIAQQLGDDSPTHAGEARAEEDSPDLDKLMQEVVQQRQQQHQQRSVSADSISLTSTDNGDAVDAAEDFDDILSTDNDDEVRPLDALRHTSKSFVFHHRSGSSSHGNGGAAAAPLSTFAALGGRGVSEVTFGNHSIVSNGAGSTSAQQQLLLSSPSFRLNLSRITSSMRHSGGGASSVGGGAGDAHSNNNAGGPLSSGSGGRHDADLDDMMSHNTSTDVSRRSLGGGGGSSQSRFMDAREINNSFTAAALTQGKGLLQQRQSSQGQSFTNSASAAAGNQNNNVVFLDSRKPQLIHLNPDAVGHTDVPLVMVLEEGENTFDIGGAHVVFVWDALGNQVVLFGTPEAIAVNGERIEDEGTILRHRDRVVILGVLAFRFSFAAGVLALEGGFNKTPTCVAHVVLLEKYYRNTVQLERSRDAMSIAKAYVYQTASLKEALESAEKTPVPRKPQSEAGNDDDDDGRPLGSAARMKAQRQSVNVTRMSRNSVSLGSNSDDSPIEFDDDYSGMSSTPRGTTPRSSDPTLAAIGNDIALFNELIYKLEVELADDYPLPEEALAGVDGDEAEGEQQRVAAESYAEAIAEVERNQQDQERELEWLKAQVLHAGNRLERESTFRGRRDRQHRAMPNMSIASPLDSKRRSLSHCFQSPPSAADRQLDFIDMGEDVAVEHSTGDPTPASMSPLSPSNNGAGPAAEVTRGAVPGEETEHATANVTTPSKAHQDDDTHVTTEAVVIDEVAETLALDDDDIEFEQGVSDQITTRIVQLELAYHRRVRALQQFSRLGPKNPDDKELWELLYTNPPFLGDSSLQCEQSCYCQVRDHWNGISAWTQRFVSASRSYLFVFKKADGRERCTAAIYLPGATLAKLNDTDVEVCPACPRHAKDTKTGNPKDASLVLRFRDAAEYDLWQEWFRVQVCPIPVPHHMLKRQVEERAALLASSATTFDLYGDEVSTAQGSPSPPQAGGKSRRMSVAIVASGGAAVQHVDQLSGTANWKPDQSSNSCEKCTKNFTFFKRRHHCRGCGGIFCADCVQKCVPFGNQLACQTCREERLASPGSFKSLSPRNQRKASKKQLRSTTTLTTGNQAAVALDTFAAVVPSDEEIYLLDALVEDFAVYIDHDPNLIRVRVDHFQGRFHTILADDLVSVARCPLNGCRLNIRCKNIQGAPALAPGGGLSASTALLSTPSSYSIGAGITPAATTVTSRSIYFQDSTTRERCFESLWVLLANQVFIDGLDGARLSSTFAHADLVVQDESEFSLLRTTSRASSDISVWAGIESTRAIPFHHGYGLYAILGFQESWSERQLEHYQLHLVSTLRLGRKKPSLYIVAHQSLRHVLQGPAVTAAVTKVTAASISGADVVVSAVGIRVFETSLVFIASNFFEYSSAVCGGGGGASGDAPQVIPSAFSSTDGKRPSYFDPSVAMAASTSVCLNGGRDEAIFDEYAAASEFSLQDLQMGGDSNSSEPHVDLLQWYDHAFLLGAPDMENIGFQRKTISDSSLVQVRTTVGASATMKKSGRTWSQFLVPALNVHAAKFSFNVPSAAVARNNNINNGGDSAERQYQRPLITVRSATFMCDDGSHAKDVTCQCELWGQQLGFDRYDHAAQRIVHDPRGSFLRKQKMKSSSTATTTPPAVDPPHQPGEREEAAVTPPPPDGSLLDIKDDNNNSNGFLRTVVLANTLADYLIAKCLRLTIPGVASCVVHMAAIPEGTTTVMTLEGTWGGGVVGLVKATIEYRMVSV
ncbi:kinesin, putative [Bodo saltans]|uniref:Kinesin, putative n=1 Tax=Bodo saltans TaxID=75058 RepID=A0A0S4JL24_BODSA|nr:kinesin, putative [Bodo saltans]|eukprot:CUG92223.1 kinesin, putative [Bodo saltans]